MQSPQSNALGHLGESSKSCESLFLLLFVSRYLLPNLFPTYFQRILPLPMMCTHESCRSLHTTPHYDTIHYSICSHPYIFVSQRSLLSLPTPVAGSTPLWNQQLASYSLHYLWAFRIGRIFVFIMQRRLCAHLFWWVDRVIGRRLMEH